MAPYDRHQIQHQRSVASGAQEDYDRNREQLFESRSRPSRMGYAEGSQANEPQADELHANDRPRPPLFDNSAAFNDYVRSAVNYDMLRFLRGRMLRSSSFPPPPPYEAPPPAYEDSTPPGPAPLRDPAGPGFVSSFPLAGDAISGVTPDYDPYESSYLRIPPPDPHCGIRRGREASLSDRGGYSGTSLSVSGPITPRLGSTSSSGSPTGGASSIQRPKAVDPDGGIMTLSLDIGGGRRTMSQLQLLDELMLKISEELGYDCSGFKNILKPCDVFHLIVGNGTSGLIAIMLGRLKMSVKEVMGFYRDVEKNVFHPLTELGEVLVKPEPRPMDRVWGAMESIGFCQKPAKTVAAERLEEEVEKLVKYRNMGTDLYDADHCQLGKVLVTAVHDLGRSLNTVKLRSYAHSPDTGFRPTIVEAVRATMAHAPFFQPASISGSPGRFTGSPVEYSNPFTLLREEVSTVFINHPRYSARKLWIGIGTSKSGDDEVELRNKTYKRLAGSKVPHPAVEVPETITFEQMLTEGARVCAKTELARYFQWHNATLRDILPEYDEHRISCSLESHLGCRYRPDHAARKIAWNIQGVL